MIPPNGLTPSQRTFFENLISKFRDLEGRVTALSVPQKKQDFGQQDTTPNPFAFQNIDLAADAQLTHSQLGIDLYVNCTVASVLKMPTFIPNGWVNIRNIGTQTVTMQTDAAGAITTVVAGASKEIRFNVDSSGLDAGAGSMGL